jgi:hypothetical protein
MKRRSVLKTLTAIPAASLLRAQQPLVPPKPTPAAVDEIPVIEGSVPDVAATTVRSFFSEDQLAALSRLSDVLYPALNGVPGALAADVPGFLDFLISQSPEPIQSKYRSGLDALNQRARKQFEVSFAQTSPDQAEAVLAPLQQPWSADPDPFVTFLRDAKEDVLQATQNSQEWSSVMSKRVRRSAGIAYYWFPIS